MSLVLLFTAGAMLFSDAIPLASVYAAPGTFEGKIIKTCGNAGAEDELYLSTVHGRSRVGVKLDRPLREQGSICLRAEVARVTIPAEPRQPVIIASHPPIILEGWHLRVIEVVKRE
jgi:hypothetical protein